MKKKISSIVTEATKTLDLLHFEILAEHMHGEVVKAFRYRIDKVFLDIFSRRWSSRVRVGLKRMADRIRKDG